MEQNNVSNVPAGERQPGQSPKSRFLNYAAVNFAFYLTMSLGGYVTVFLQSIGFNAQQVGVITALNSGAGVFSSPFWGMLSDKLRSLKKIIVVTLVTGAALFALIPVSGGLSVKGIPFVFALIPVTMFFKSPTMSLVENWMLRNSSNERLNYGALRAFGAFSYAVASLALGYLLPITGVTFTFYANAVLTLPSLAMVVFIRGSADDAELSKKRLTFKEMQIGQLAKNYYLITYIMFTVFQRIPFQCSMTFLPYLVADIGGDTAQMGIIMGIRAFVEIPMMLLLKPLRQRIPLYYLIMIASSFFMAECLMYSFANSFGAVVAISVLHGIGNGLLLPTGSSYVFSLAPDHLKATAQTVLGSVNSVAGILSGVLGGIFITMLGIKQFYMIIGLMMIVTLSLFALSFIIGEKVLGKKRPGLSIV